VAVSVRPPLTNGISTLCDGATARRRIPKRYHYQSQLGGYYTAEKNTIDYIEGVFSYGGNYATMVNQFISASRTSDIWRKRCGVFFYQAKTQKTQGG